MIYHVTYNAQRQKIASRVNNREEFLAIRNSGENLAHLTKARTGDEKAKGKLAQFAYNLGHVEGPLAGCKSIGSYFFHDIDCYNQTESQAMAQQIMAKKDEIGLKMLEKSASGGYHLVCKRQPGTTILENQVRIASILQLEMDTNTHDLQRVSYSSSGTSDDLVYLDDELFAEPMSTQECEAEFALLKDRERNGQEQVPAGAKKARKHYCPWKEVVATDSPREGCDSVQVPVTPHADDDMPTSKRGPRSLLDLLPGTFTIDDAKQVRINLVWTPKKQAIWLAPGKSAIMWYRWQMAVLKKHQYIKHYDYNTKYPSLPGIKV